MLSTYKPLNITSNNYRFKCIKVEEEDVALAHSSMGDFLSVAG
jgi:hypothetical protein